MFALVKFLFFTNVMLNFCSFNKIYLELNLGIYISFLFFLAIQKNLRPLFRVLNSMDTFLYLISLHFVEVSKATQILAIFFIGTIMFLIMYKKKIVFLCELPLAEKTTYKKNILLNEVITFMGLNSIIRSQYFLDSFTFVCQQIRQWLATLSMFIVLFLLSIITLKLHLMYYLQIAILFVLGNLITILRLVNTISGLTIELFNIFKDSQLFCCELKGVLKNLTRMTGVGCTAVVAIKFDITASGTRQAFDDEGKAAVHGMGKYIRERTYEAFNKDKIEALSSNTNLKSTLELSKFDHPDKDPAN